MRRLRVYTTRADKPHVYINMVNPYSGYTSGVPVSSLRHGWLWGSTDHATRVHARHKRRQKQQRRRNCFRAWWETDAP